jgi:2-phospho-L-lactate guanylyltransferase (CobY/MobA/RfbA family)
MRLSTLGVTVVILGVVGLAGYDGFAIMSNNVSTENDAQDAAYAASQAWHNDNENLNLAYQAAVQSVAGKHETVLTQGFTVDADGTIHLLVRRTANTVVFSKIGPLKHLTIATEHGDANSVN